MTNFLSPDVFWLYNKLFDIMTHFYVSPGMTGGTLCFRVVHPSFRQSVHPSVLHTLAPHPSSSSTQFGQEWVWRKVVVKHSIKSKPSQFRGTTLHAVPSKNYAFSTNYHAWIALPTWPRCAPPILFWPWPPYNLLPRSCFTWIFFVDSHWSVQLCLQRPPKAMPFQQISIYALQCQHDVDVHLLFCFDHMTCSQGRV